jgi:rubrerythrin
MDSATRTEIEKIFLEVSRTAARNKLYAMRAEQDGKTQAARLFRAMAISEEAQAVRFLLQLRGQTGKHAANCSMAFEEELPALITHCEQAQQTAAASGERAMEAAFSHSAKVARIFLGLKKKLDKDSTKSAPYHVCSFCGFTMEGNAPHKCPICTAPAQRFVEV